MDVDVAMDTAEEESRGRGLARVVVVVVVVLFLFLLPSLALLEVVDEDSSSEPKTRICGSISSRFSFVSSKIVVGVSGGAGEGSGNDGPDEDCWSDGEVRPE